MSSIIPVSPEEAPPIPNWLLKLEEQRAKRLKAKLGHEAGAGAPCQICGTKCPGLDLHFWRKICKICKCGKEDHDISDEDIYGFVQFTLLGSKPVKTKGIVLKGSNNEVLLEFLPKGSSNDVKKYLDELPEELLPVKGSEAARLRKQRLQKQMPAHDIDPSLCHALTDEEIKQLEEYVAFIRKHSVGQGSIIRLPLYRGAQQHTLNKSNAKLVSNTFPKQQIASQETVFLQPSDMSNQLQNLTLIHPLTTSNVERHQEQYENPNFQLNNANLNYNNASSKYQLDDDLGNLENLEILENLENLENLEDLEIPVKPPPINDATHPALLNYNDQNCNTASGGSGGIGAASRIPNQLIEPINDRQVPCLTGYVKDLNYPVGVNTSKPIVGNKSASVGNKSAIVGNKPASVAANKMVLRAEAQINPTESHQNLTSVGLIQDLNYPALNLNLNLNNLNVDDNNSNVPSSKCHECTLPIAEGSVAVSAERTPNLWHAKCFNCRTCKQPLADLLYFYHKDTDHIYCGRDYAILRGLPRCSACDELIFVREYCLAEERTFHVKHFCCFECDQPLAGKSYLMEANQPVCLECFENLKAEMCRCCMQTIRPEEQGVCLQDLHWHATDTCFVCVKCRKPLLGGKMLLRNDSLFCSDFCFKNY